MSTDSRDERLDRRIADLLANDPQFAAAEPDEALSASLDGPDVRLHQIVDTVLEGYADRPALGQRAVRFVEDPQTGRTTAELLPQFDTISYAELGSRMRATAAAPRPECGVCSCSICISRSMTTATRSPRRASVWPARRSRSRRSPTSSSADAPPRRYPLTSPMSPTRWPC